MKYWNTIIIKKLAIGHLRPQNIAGLFALILSTPSMANLIAVEFRGAASFIESGLESSFSL
ncbi:hypothetical protein BMS3Bbin11_00621 [bacterium BMS3Bbin11]|nr:hypothetical protein BMS3Abin11_00934 [bacterium BMS3Abin11]GBE45532.1 hypothetical protein BMS3Bbin11_00621 [bacterium BMS3Bbin11]